MGLKATITPEELAVLPEAIKPLYVEKGGKHLLDVDEVEGYALENVHGLRSTLDAVRGENRSLKEKTKPFDDLDPVKAREALARVKEMETWTPPEKALEREKAREAQLSEKHETEKKALKTEIEQNASEVRRLLVDVESRRVLMGKDPSKPVGSYELLEPVIARHTKVERDPTTGRPVTKVLDKNGNVMITRQKDKDHDMELEEFIMDVLRPQPAYAPAFYGSQASGAGTRSADAVTGVGKKQVKVVNRSDLEGLGENLEAIASGEVVVVDG